MVRQNTVAERVSQKTQNRRTATEKMRFYRDGGESARCVVVVTVQ